MKKICFELTAVLTAMTGGIEAARLIDLTQLQAPHPDPQIFAQAAVKVDGRLNCEKSK